MGHELNQLGTTVELETGSTNNEDCNRRGVCEWWKEPSIVTRRKFETIEGGGGVAANRDRTAPLPSFICLKDSFRCVVEMIRGSPRV